MSYKKVPISKKSINKSYIELVERGKIDVDYIFLTAIAAIVCTLGFEMNSPSVIIGAMVIYPLLCSPILVGVSVFWKDRKAFFRGCVALLVGIVVAVTISIIFNIIFPSHYTAEITGRLSTLPLHYFLVAFFTGLGGTFAYFWPGIIETITGIAISVALIPPLVMIGIGIAHNDFSLFYTSMVISAINIFGVCVASFLAIIILYRLSRD